MVDPSQNAILIKLFIDTIPTGKLYAMNLSLFQREPKSEISHTIQE